MKKRMFFSALIVVLWVLGYFYLPSMIVAKSQYQAQAFQTVAIFLHVITALLLLITWLTLWRAE